MNVHWWVSQCAGWGASENDLSKSLGFSSLKPLLHIPSARANKAADVDGGAAWSACNACDVLYFLVLLKRRSSQWLKLATGRWIPLAQKKGKLHKKNFWPASVNTVAERFRHIFPFVSAKKQVNSEDGRIWPQVLICNAAHGLQGLCDAGVSLNAEPQIWISVLWSCLS